MKNKRKGFDPRLCFFPDNFIGKLRIPKMNNCASTFSLSKSHLKKNVVKFYTFQKATNVITVFSCKNVSKYKKNRAAYFVSSWRWKFWRSSRWGKICQRRISWNTKFLAEPEFFYLISNDFFPRFPNKSKKCFRRDISKKYFFSRKMQNWQFYHKW